MNVGFDDGGSSCQDSREMGSMIGFFKLLLDGVKCCDAMRCEVCMSMIFVKNPQNRIDGG